jgi:AmmeMemoRadiSam system protein B
VHSDIPPRALIAPHAGLRYSGAVAACAYKAAMIGRYSAVLIVGPSHFVGFDGVSIWASGQWQTPFGDVPVAESIAERIVAASSSVRDERKPHVREHSLELQMPFVGHLFPGIPIVPLLMGFQTRQTACSLGDTLASVLRAAGEPVLLVASSDLSHYHDAGTAASMDATVLQHVDAFDAAGLMDALEQEPHHACGGGPMVAVMRAAGGLGATNARVLKYADSGDVSGDKSSVVGYMAAAFW